MVGVVNSLYSYGLPSASEKMPASPSSQPGTDSQMQTEVVAKEKPTFLDFTITHRIVYLCTLTNQILQRYSRINPDLE